MAEKTSLAQHVAANVRSLASVAGINGSDLARALGVTQASVSLKWRGKRDWKLDEIEAIAKILHVKPAALCKPNAFLATVGYDERPATMVASRVSSVRPEGFEPPTF